MKSFNLSDWALEHRSLVWYFMIAFMAAGLLRLPPARARGGSCLHHQDHGDPGPVARRHSRGNHAPGHRPDREEARGAGIARLHQQRDHAGQTTVFVNLQDTTKAATSGRPGSEVRNMIDDIKGELPARRRRAVLQRPLRRRVRQHLRLHRDGLTQRQLRDYVEDVRAKVSDGAECRQGRHGRRAGRGDLSSNSRPARSRPSASTQQRVMATAAGPECDHAVRRHPGRSRAHQRAGERPVHLRGEPAAINLRINDRFFRLTDVATITPRLRRSATDACSGSTASRPSALPSA